MRDIEIPGTFRLEHIRAVVQEIVNGADSSSLIGEKTGLSSRHVSLALSAGRLLGWLTGTRGRLQVTGVGAELLRSRAGSHEEARLVESAINESRPIQKLAPDLLKNESLDFEALNKRIVKMTGRSEASARRGARVLLSWKRQILEKLATHQESRQATGEHPARSSSQPPAGEAIKLLGVRIERFGPLREAQADLHGLTVILGGCGVGKSTFIDALSFVGDALRVGLVRALASRASRLAELLYNNGKATSSFGIALELGLPPSFRPDPRLARARYELVIGESGMFRPEVQWEALFFRPDGGRIPRVRSDADQVPKTWRSVLISDASGRAGYRAETSEQEFTFNLSRERLALAAAPEDRRLFRATLALRSFLQRGVKRLCLKTHLLREPCSPLASSELLDDGSNLAAVILRLHREAPQELKAWLAHVQAALPEVKDVRVVERIDDHHLSLEMLLKNGLTIPFNRISDGMLRLFALMSLPFDGIGAPWLVDEGFHGLHPRAIGELTRCWAKAGDRVPIIVTTSSPLWARLVKLEHLLCLHSDANGDVQMTPGRRHDPLKKWRSSIETRSLTDAFPMS